MLVLEKSLMLVVLCVIMCATSLFVSVVYEKFEENITKNIIVEMEKI